MENASLHPVVRDQKTDDADEHQCNNLDIPGTDNVALSAVDASTQVVVHSAFCHGLQNHNFFGGFQIDS
jgi:hypothetical protein